MRAPLFFAFLAALLPAMAPAAIAGPSALDDDGRRVTLAAPARRIISMSPHATELLFAAGGGERVVGAMAFGGYPPEAKSIPLVGDSSGIDVELVLSLKPDLIVVWESGNTVRQLEQLHQLRIPLFYSEPTRLEQVADSLHRFGQLLGTEAQADAAAAAFRAKVADLEQRYSQRAPVRVFYQVWNKTLSTLNGQHLVSDAIRLCGGVNIYGTQLFKAPPVWIEDVLQRDPEVLVGTGRTGPRDRGLDFWKPYPSLLAVRRSNLFTLDGELLTRPSPRVVEAVATLCEKLELARQRRK